MIELKNYTLSEVKDLLPKYLTSVCKLTEEELVAIQNDTKAGHRLLVVLDGFDELKQEANGDNTARKRFKDCFEACGAQAWHTGQVKVVVTCRVRSMDNPDVERQYFAHGVLRDYRRRILLPFSSTKIEEYLRERTQTGSSSKLKLLPSQDYHEVLQASPSVKEMVRNPFVLRLFIEALPKLKRSGMDLNRIKRFDIYGGFVRQWFEREVYRLSEKHQAALGVGTTDVDSVISNFERYAGILAMEMYRNDSLVVTYDQARSDEPAFRVWRQLDEAVAASEMDEEATRRRLAEEYAALGAVAKRKLQRKEKIADEAAYIEARLESVADTEFEQVDARLEAFKLTSPLRQSGDNYSFIHKSFYEYFLAMRMVQIVASEKSLPERVTEWLTHLTPP